jgi:tetratricopeptide (TPR) repeat protein
VVTTALVAVSLIAGLAGTAWQARVATRRFNDVRALAHAVVFDIHDAIANLPGSTKARETLVQHALRYLDHLNREARGDLGLQRELAVAYSKIGDVQGRPMFPNLGHPSAALESYDKAMRLLGEVTRAQPESTAIVHDWITLSLKRSDLLLTLGQPREAMDEAMDNRRRILSELRRRPGNRVLEDDLCVNYSHVITMKRAAADTLGAIEDCTAYLALVESLFRAEPGNPDYRRGALIANTKMAQLRGPRGERDSARVFYQRAEDLAHQAVDAQPNNTDAARDLSIVMCEHALFLSDGGEIDSALAVYGRAMKISEDLAAKDPDDVLQQADLANSHYEIGTMLVHARRYPAARERFEEAFDRYARIAAADSANLESRIYMARCGRLAGEACRELSNGSRSGEERARWRSLAMTWLVRSQTLYQALGKAGALAGEEIAAPDEVDRLVAGMRKD